MSKPMVLIILDGFGHRAESSHNPIQNTSTPTIDKLFTEYPHIFIEASEEAVGLPKGQMGNSEVGHLHLGAGRKILQNLARIQNEIDTGAFFENPALVQAIQKAKAVDGAIHILGLVSPGGVHSHEKHICALIEMIGKQGVSKNYLHAILDGRDTPPQSALPSLQRINKYYEKCPGGQIASLVGRYYAMDRDKRWDRTQKAYDLLTLGEAPYFANTAKAALEIAYQRDETDEFVSPTIISKDGKPITVNNGDVIIFMNFRADRARQLTQAFTEPHFDAFTRQKIPTLSAYVTLTHYLDNPLISVAYSPLKIRNTLGEFLSEHGYSQLRLAETEKYAHVTYFFNGGVENPFPNEKRQLIPSPKVATYDLQPAMSAIALTDVLVAAIEAQETDVIVCNYANPDMVGHTGNEKAADEAIHVIDECLAHILKSLKKVGAEALITADHGNIEVMYDQESNQPHTAHTTNLVPLIYVGDTAYFTKKTGALDDVAPTLLYLMGCKPPNDMTGHILLKKDN